MAEALAVVVVVVGSGCGRLVEVSGRLVDSGTLALVQVEVEVGTSSEVDEFTRDGRSDIVFEWKCENDRVH